MEQLVKSIEDTVLNYSDTYNTIDGIEQVSAIIANDMRDMTVLFAKYVRPWQDMISDTATYMELFEEFLEVYYKQD